MCESVEMAGEGFKVSTPQPARVLVVVAKLARLVFSLIVYFEASNTVH